MPRIPKVGTTGRCAVLGEHVVLAKQTFYALILWRGAQEDAASFLASDWLWQRERRGDDDQMYLQLCNLRRRRSTFVRTGRKERCDKGAPLFLSVLMALSDVNTISSDARGLVVAGLA